MSKPRKTLYIENIETLESRRLLAANPAGLLAQGFEEMRWAGQTVYVRPNQWIAKVDGLNGVAGKQLNTVNGAIAAARAGAVKAVQHLGRDGLMLFESSKSYKQMQRALGKSAGLDVAALEPDFAIWTTATPDDQHYAAHNWGLNNTGQSGGRVDADIDAPEAWDITTGDGSVVVGVIDSGVDHTHADLSANMWRNPGEIAGNRIDDDRNGYTDDVYGWDFFNNDANPMDDNGHGTHVAGTIAAAGNNKIGVAGVAWNAKVMALKFLGADGSGSLSGALAAINYATRMRTQYGVNVRVTNNSWGGGGYSSALFDAISKSAQAGILFVAAAGNGGLDGIGDNNDFYAQYPAGYNVDNVISVAATDHNDLRAGFSNYGASSVDLAAPGVNIASTASGGGYVYMSGTSMATPHVSGVAALAFGYNPRATYQQVRRAIFNGVDKNSGLSGRTVTGGRLNALKTLLNMPAPARQLINLAQGKATGQSSTDHGGLASRAIDGNTDGTYTNDSVSHTAYQSQPWWQIDLGASSWIDHIELWNRADGLESRLGNVYVLVSDSPFTSSSLSTAMAQSGVSTYRYPGVPSPSAAVAVGRNARYVRVQLADTQYLSLAEVKVIGEASTVVEQNLAQGRAATQSTTDFGGEASRAVDGNTDGAYANNSVTHTAYQSQPWWQVDLGASADLTNIEIWNRGDGVADRLSDFYVLVSDVPFASSDLTEAMAQAGVSSYHVQGSPDPNTTIAIGRSGRYVRVQMAGGYLSLAEVKVFGSAAGA